jgi:hypothetical protein
MCSARGGQALYEAGQATEALHMLSRGPSVRRVRPWTMRRRAAGIARARARGRTARVGRRGGYRLPAAATCGAIALDANLLLPRRAWS